jgi:16S rRNA (cytidine1402-2'-O)-methyltransferase
MPGTLYVVATPIGNLEDVTLRALRILREVSVIAAEDTRRAARLLQHYSISTHTTSLHEHNERSRTPGLISRLLAGESVALVSDAGTPVVSDPGAHLVAAAHAAGIRVEAIPGANAAIAALSVSGFPDREFIFVGFPPPKSGARRKWLQALAQESRTIIVYEAPHRILHTLEDMLAILGNRPIAVARELTKAHEELVVRPISEHLAAFSVARGEYTLVLMGNPGDLAADLPPLSESEAAKEFGELTESGAVPRREALRMIAARHQLPVGQVYDLLEAAKKSGV